MPIPRPAAVTRRPRPPLALLALVAACSGGEPPFQPVDPDPDPGSSACPVEEMVHVPGAEAVTLGETALDDPELYGSFPNALLRWEQDVPDFCISRHPFPGEGFPYAQNGDPPERALSNGEVEAILDVLPGLGLRLCRTSESVYAFAGGTRGDRFFYGDTREPGRCSDADGADPIGSHPECVNSLGLADVGIRPTWTELDPEVRAAISAWGETNPTGMGFPGIHPELRVVVGSAYCEGATSTACNNFAVHWHYWEPGAFYDAGQGQGGRDWWDDVLRICADPGPPDADVQATWDDLVSRFEARGYDYAVLWGG